MLAGPRSSLTSTTLRKVGTFTAFAGQLVGSEAKRVYADLDGDASQELDRLMALAMEGRIAAVALAGLELRGGLRQARAPLMTDGNPGAVEYVVRGLEQATRRQLRLATLLHTQAAAILRLRAVPRGQRVGEAVWSWLRRRTRGGSDGDSVGRGNGALRLRVHRLLAAPRLKLWRVPFRQDDLDSLEVVFDAIGEAVANALECLADGEPMPLRVPAGRRPRAGSLRPARPNLQPGLARSGSSTRRARRVGTGSRFAAGLPSPWTMLPHRRASPDRRGC